jgi:hypothetical protein
MRRLVALCALAGCDYVFRIDYLEPPAPDAPCQSNAWGPRVMIGELAGTRFDPSARGDLRELLHVAANPTGGGYDIQRSVRGNVGDLFGAEQLVIELNSQFDDTDPALTADGLVVFFKSRRGGIAQVWEAARATTDAAFGAPALAQGLAFTSANGLDVSPDGLTIYVDDGLMLVTAHRPSRAEPFVVESSPMNARAAFPSVSANGLELFLDVPAAGISVRTRGDVTQSFTNEMSIDPDAGDPEISVDGRTLFMSTSNGLAMMTRCL